MNEPDARTGMSGQPVAGVAAPAPQAPLVMKLLIILFTLSYMTAAMYLVVDCWVLGQTTLKAALGLPADHLLPEIFVSAVFAVLGAVLGAGALDLVSFHRYVAVKRDFQAPHVWGYFFAPWLAAVLGLIVFALVRSGLLVFGGGPSGESPSDVSNLGYLAVGFLSGFGWFQATERIREIVSGFFRSGQNTAQAARRPPQPATGAGAGEDKLASPSEPGEARDRG
jgi:hypothetical protein